MCGRRLKTRWTLAKSAVQFCWMWRACIGLLLLAAPAWADENATAYEALRVVGREFGRDALHQIVSITGTRGNPQPEKWKIVLEDPQGGGVREVEVADGNVASDDKAEGDVAGVAEGGTVDLSRLNLDSSGAYAVVSHTAKGSHTSFATTDYTLRTDDRGEPMWIVTLQSKSLHPIGTIYIGGGRAAVPRAEREFGGEVHLGREIDEEIELENRALRSVANSI